MKKILFSIAMLLINIAQINAQEENKEIEEFNRAYLNVIIQYGEDSIKHFEGANAFTFNVNQNSIVFYPHSGPKETFIYMGEQGRNEDSYGDSYQFIRAIEVNTSKIVYFQLYDIIEYGLNLIYVEDNYFVHFYNKQINE
mgnify:FL=1|tara:strand:+ start:1981 stop:2400 length:420 start_codon:yes stop_codon:yes gene_type:complete